MNGMKTYLVAVMAFVIGGGAWLDWWSVDFLAGKGEEVLALMGVAMAFFRSITTGPAKVTPFPVDKR